MPRFQTCDTFGDCLEAKRAGTAALGLYYLCGLWSARYLTDGHIPSEVAASYGTPEWARKLCDAGLWVAEDGGYWMPRYLEDNPSAEKVRREREMKAERQNKWLENKRSASSPQRRVSRQSTSASKGATRDASKDGALPLPSPKGEGVGAAPLRGAPPPPTKTTARHTLNSSESCDLHMLALPCRGCAADAKAAPDDVDQPQQQEATVINFQRMWRHA